MTVLLALLSKAWPAMLAGAVLGIFSGWVVHKADSVAYARLQTTYASYQTQVADQELKAQEAARSVLQQQADDRAATDKRNQGIIDDLTKRAASAESDRDFARRLLGSTLKAPVPSGGQLPQAGHQSGTAPAGSKTVGASLETLTASAIGECEHNADQLDALIAELKPQL